MSAQNYKPGGLFTAILGFFGFSALAGLLVTVMVTPALAVTGITASSTIGIFDSLPENIEIGQQPEKNEIWANFTGKGNTNGHYKIADIYFQNREEVAYDEISPHAHNAAVDGEDRRFFEHGGVDIASVLRATFGNLSEGDIESGASTITMQLVKQIFVQDALNKPNQEERDKAYKEAVETSFDRKLKEMKLAISLEKKYTKKEILTAYLNIAFFGDNTYGIQAAAQRYFSIPASELTPAQAASLVAIVQYPGIRSLDNQENFAANEERRDHILGEMLKAEHLTEAEYQEAVDIPVNEEFLKPRPPSNGCIAAYKRATWFCDYVERNIENFEALGANPEERAANWKQGGYKLYTTLDIDLQYVAQERVWDYADPAATALSLGAAAISVEPGTGRILTMAENKIFNNSVDGGGPATSAVNYNTNFTHGGSSGIQSGSTYKLFTLLAWLEAGKGLREVVQASGRTVNMAEFTDSCAGGHTGPWKFRNSSGESGSRSVLRGTTSSTNGVFVSMALQLDLCDIKQVAEDLGVERADGNELKTNPSSVLGTNEVTPLSMAGAYAAIAANGKYCEPIILDRVVGPDGEELPGQQTNCRQAVDPEVAATAAYALATVMSGGTGTASNPRDGVPIIGKTGTTDSSEQTWIITSTTEVATAVWVGNSIGSVSMRSYRYNGTSGTQLRHAIMRGIVAAANAKYSGNAFPGPSDRLMTGTGATVPALVGLTLEKATSTLEALGFTVANGGQVDSELEAGLVASSDPGAGARIARGMTVTLYLSNGNQIQVPDVVSGNPHFNQARNALFGAGFMNVNEVCAVTEDNSLVGRVISTNPPPGSFANPSAQIDVGVGALTCDDDED